ncbi:Tripartite-type tricarboxylate transporter, receptor component TctC [Xaviernesmea oryzae]|uniref:Tripartite-type tricarboxylate transporter, receptor component TctC n=1 Tax=Xaviernesmea oryzae TaxID=464029 RepID=A0A1X7FPY1_9HYPH|nr:tripartite tricarboxylate transporter substrate binding protein [Xaviernesmea oryzae]SMF56396.1 Tripartite-type tricarboxylate transporter, receptor component TctC [Xaviernesmea oryzae]
MKIRTLVSLAATLLTATAGELPAADYPTRPITFVIPFAPGGGNDILGRVVSARAAKELGGVIVVENRPGAGGGLAAQHVIEGAADGYTVLQGNVAHAINMSLYKKPGYDFAKDFEPVTLMATSALLICVNPRSPANNLQDLIQLAKKNPGKMTFGSSGIGGSSHLAFELFKAQAGVDLLHIPYQGGAPMTTDLVAGRLDVALPVPSGAKSLMASGKIKCFATTGSRRSKSMPDIPTVAEAADLAGYEAAPWYGVVVKAGTPPEIIERLARAYQVAVNDPEVQKVLLEQGFDVVGNTPQEFGAYIKTEIEKWSQVVAKSGATAE